MLAAERSYERVFVVRASDLDRAAAQYVARAASGHLITSSAVTSSVRGAETIGAFAGLEVYEEEIVRINVAELI